MKVAIMQPYFFPYIGYFQLINHVDVFVIYDEIEYTKKGWINRNRILSNGVDELITIPLKKDSDFLMVNERSLASDWSKHKDKTVNKIKEAYKKAPNFERVFPLIVSCFEYLDLNLFHFIYHSIKQVCSYLGITTKMIISSSLDIDPQKKATDKVITICQKLNATEYINPIGGIQLYDKDFFLQNGLLLRFLKSNNFEYKQYENEFIPFLSIIDVLMFNSIEESKNIIVNEYSIW
jgi:WbqC-like protein family